MKSAPKVRKSTPNVTFIIKTNTYFLLVNDLLAVQGKTNISKTHKNNVETEAEAKAEALAGRVQGGNNDSPLADNCYEVSTV